MTYGRGYRFAIDPELELLRNESDGRHVRAHTRISDSLPARHYYRGRIRIHTHARTTRTSHSSRMTGDVSPSRTGLREIVDHRRTRGRAEVAFRKVAR